MAIARAVFYERERAILDKLETEQGDKVSRAQSISGTITDIKQSLGRWTVAFLLKWLYRDSMDDLKKDLARATLISNEFEQSSVDKFQVLSALWPAISRLSVVDDVFLSLIRYMQLNAQDFYKNGNI